ncbi:LANO_0G12156g1_1 [Lachancea nothofagi CBS 11611]|uniref:Cytochrome c oxidase subunit 9, mitochondrial n=1 Tax=Lachancea nothofagi CBS 11611 TaxID=1266666 RepID=A0A1G4KJW2_9SACH|nr:LANO_0G12156g1_1 [Lachancea nothofagi CBS 11611]
MSAITPITGTLKKRIIADLTIGFAIGGVMGGYYWWGFHKGLINKREAFYANLAAEKAAEN